MAARILALQTVCYLALTRYVVKMLRIPVQPSSVTTAKAWVTFKRIVPPFASVAPEQEVDVVTLVASQAIWQCV